MNCKHLRNKSLIFYKDQEKLFMQTKNFNIGFFKSAPILKIDNLFTTQCLDADDFE